MNPANETYKKDLILLAERRSALFTTLTKLPQWWPNSLLWGASPETHVVNLHLKRPSLLNCRGFESASQTVARCKIFTEVGLTVWLPYAGVMHLKRLSFKMSKHYQHKFVRKCETQLSYMPFTLYWRFLTGPSHGCRVLEITWVMANYPPLTSSLQIP